jgi:hypothetical protein
MDTLVYAPESANQHESWQLGLPAHYLTELPNIAPLAHENLEAASLPPQSLLLMYVLLFSSEKVKISRGLDFQQELALWVTKTSSRAFLFSLTITANSPIF